MGFFHFLRFEHLEDSRIKYWNNIFCHQDVVVVFVVVVVVVIVVVVEGVVLEVVVVVEVAAWSSSYIPVRVDSGQCGRWGSRRAPVCGPPPNMPDQ